MYLKIDGEMHDNNKKYFQRNITNDCNKKCSYCYQKNDREKNIWYEKNTKNVINELNKAQQNNNAKEYFLNIIGGEPLLHKDLIKYKDDIDIKYCLMSNLEFKFDYIEQFFSKNLYLFFTTIHFENNVELVLDNIKKIKDIGYGCNVNVMVENIVSEDKIIDTYEYLKSLNCGTVKLITIFSNNKLQNEYYKNVDMSKFKKYQNEIYRKNFFSISNNKNNFFNNLKTKNVLCNVGKYFGCIQSGMFYRCSCYAHQNKNKHAYYDKNIFENEIICKDSTCAVCDLTFGMKKGYFSLIQK